MVMKRAASRVSRFIAKWATTFIGKYLENVSEDSFELGLNSGKLQLKNVKIKEGLIEQLKLPIKLTHGFIETINISIPYGNIFRPGNSSPLVIEINDLSLSTKFISEEEFDTSKIESFLIMERLRLIEHWNIRFITELAEDEYFKGRRGYNLNGNKPFLGRIISVLIQDIRLKFRRIHIVMEDILNKESCFGLMLNSLEVCSIPNLGQVLVNGKNLETIPPNKDELGPGLINYYEEQLDFVKGWFDLRTECSNSKLFEPFFEKNDSNDFSYRLLDLDGFSIYFGSKRTGKGSNETIMEQNPVIHPFCCKLLLRQRKDLLGTSKKPIYTIYGVLEEIYVTLSEQIVAQCGTFLNHIQVFNKHIEMGKQYLERKFLYRPNVPVHNNAKLWWKYAVGCIIRKRREMIGGGIIGTSNSYSSNLFIRLQEEFIEAKILMYCREYTEEFHKFFENNMKNTPMNSFFDGWLFNDLLLDFSKQYSEYYLTRVPFSRFVSLHTSLVHQWVGKRLEVHLYRSKSDQSESLSTGTITSNWIQWLFNFHRISSPPNNEYDVFYDANEVSDGSLVLNKSLSGEKIEQAFTHESFEFDDSHFLSRGMLSDELSELSDIQFYDCNSDESEDEIGSKISEYDHNIQKKSQSYTIKSDFSPMKLYGINSDVPFIIFRLILRETKLEVIVDETNNEFSSKKGNYKGRNVLLGKLKNFGLEYIQSDSRLSILFLLEEFILDCSNSNGDIYHLIYADNSKIDGDNMWFTFYYLSKNSSICDVPQNSRGRSSLSQSSDFSIDKTISAKMEDLFTDNKTSVKISVEKCYVNIYSHIVSIVIGFIDKYKLIRSDPYTKKRVKKEQHKSTESGNGGFFLMNSSNMNVDIRIETPILVFCHEDENKEKIYCVISFGKISISNNENLAIKDVNDDNGLELSNPKQEGSFEYQNIGNRASTVSPYYRYVLSENTIYWFRCIHHQSYFVRVEEIYVCIYKSVHPSSLIEDEHKKLNFNGNEDGIYKTVKTMIDSVNSYRLFSIDFIDIKFNLLSYKKYNMVDETWIKYIKLFGVLNQLDPLSVELFDEKQFMSLVLSTNSVNLDSKSLRIGCESFKIEDNLNNIYSSIQINTITSNFNPMVYQSLYKNVINWIHDSELNKYFDLGDNIKKETEFKMFKLGLNIQFFWYVQLNSLLFDLVSESNSIVSLETNNIQILYFVFDHHNNLNTFIKGLSLNYLNENINNEGEVIIIPLINLIGFYIFMGFPTTLFHFITKEVREDSFFNNEMNYSINNHSINYNDTKIKFESESIVLYLRPLVLQEVINIINTLLQKTNYNSNSDDNLNSTVTNDNYNENKYLFSGDIKSFELIAFQRDTKFLRINFSNFISIYDKDEKREIDINVNTLGLYNFCNDIETCVLDFDSRTVENKELDTSKYLKIKIISHEGKHFLNDVNKNIKNLISKSEVLVDAQNISIILFFDVFLHNIYYFGNIVDNIQYLLDSSEDKGKNNIISVPLRDLIVRNSRIIIPCGTLESNLESKKGIMLNFELFNFNNKYIICDSDEYKLYILIFKFLNIELEYIDGIEGNAVKNDFSYNNANNKIIMGYIPNLNFHIRRYQTDGEKFGSFDMSCFTKQDPVKIWLNLSPKTFSAFLDVFMCNLLCYDNCVLMLNDLSNGTLSDPNFTNYSNREIIVKERKYVQQIIRNEYLGKSLLELVKKRIEACYFIKYDDSVQPSHSIHIFFPNIKINLINELDSTNLRESTFLTINMDYTNISLTRFIQKQLFIFNLRIMGLKFVGEDNFHLLFLSEDKTHENNTFFENQIKNQVFLNNHYFTIFSTKTYLEKYFNFEKNNMNMNCPLEVSYYYSFCDKGDSKVECDDINPGNEINYSNWKFNLNFPKLRVDSEMKALFNLHKWLTYCNLIGVKTKEKERNTIVDRNLSIKEFDVELLNNENTVNIKSSCELNYMVKNDNCSSGKILNSNKEINFNTMIIDSHLKFRVGGFKELIIWENFELQVIYNVMSDMNSEGRCGEVKKNMKIITQPSTVYLYYPHIQYLYEILECYYNNINFSLSLDKSLEVNQKDLILLQSFKDMELSVNLIVQNSKFILLNSINGYTNVPLLMLFIQSDDLLAVFKDNKLNSPTSIVNNGDFTFWVLNPKHGFFEPIIEECNFVLKYDKYSQITDNYSPKGKTHSKITKKLNINLPTTLNINSSQILLKTLLKHYNYWKNSPALINNTSFKQFEPLVIINKTGCDIKLIGYSNFYDHYNNLNNHFSVVILNNEKRSIYRFNNDFKSMNVFLLDVLIGKSNINNDKFDENKLNTFETIFRLGKVVNIEKSGFFAFPVKTTNEKITKLAYENSYLFCDVENNNIDDLGIQKTVTLTTPIELHNELDFDLDIILNYCDSRDEKTLLCNQSINIPIYIYKSGDNNNIYYKGREANDKNNNVKLLSEYDVLPLCQIFNNIVKDCVDLNKCVEKEEKKHIYHIGYYECNVYKDDGLLNRVGFYIVVEGRNYIYKHENYYKYSVKLKPLLTLISTLPINLYFRIINIELRKDLEEYTEDNNSLDRKSLVLNFGIIDYLKTKKLYVPVNANKARIESFKFEIGLLKNSDEKNVEKDFTVFWSYVVNLSTAIKQGFWNNHNIIRNVNKSSKTLNFGNNNIVQGRENHDTFFSVYNNNSINDYPNGYTLSWLIHSNYWFDYLGSEIIPPRQIFLPDFLPFNSNLQNYNTNINWLLSKENYFKNDDKFPLKHTIFPLIKKNKSVKSNIIVLVINNTQYYLKMGPNTNNHSSKVKPESNHTILLSEGKVSKIYNKLLDIYFNVFFEDIKLELSLNDNTKLELIVRHMLLYPKSIIYNKSSYQIEIKGNKNYVVDSNSILPFIPTCTIKSDSMDNDSRLMNMRVNSKTYYCFYLNINKSWKILLFNNKEDNNGNINRSYLLVNSRYNYTLNFELLLITERSVDDINNGLCDSSIPSLYICNISGRGLYISQKNKSVKTGDDNNSKQTYCNLGSSNERTMILNDTDAKRQYFPHNTVLEFIWENNFDPRELYIHNHSDFNSISVENYCKDSCTKETKAKYINLYSTNLYSCNKKNNISQFEVYNFGLSNKKYWIIYRICKIYKSNNYVLCLLSYSHFMDWYSNKGLTKKALSLLQSSTRPYSSSSLLLSPNSMSNNRKQYRGNRGTVPSTSLNRFSIYKNMLSSSENYIIDIYSSKIVLSTIWDNNINKNPEELFLLVLDNIYCKYNFYKNKNSPHDLQLSLGDLKVDVQYGNTIYPVLLQRLPSSSSRTLNTLEQKFMDSNRSDFISIVQSNHYYNRKLNNNGSELLLPIFVISCNFNLDEIISGSLSTVENNDIECENKGQISIFENSFKNKDFESYFIDNYLHEIKDYICDNDGNSCCLNINLIIDADNNIGNKIYRNKQNDYNNGNNNIRIITINYLSTRLMGINICFDTHLIYTLTMFINQIKELFDDNGCNDNKNDDIIEECDEYNIIDKKDIIKQFSIKQSITDHIFIKNFKIYPMVIHLTFNLNMLKNYFSPPLTNNNTSNTQNNCGSNQNVLKNLNITKILEQFAHNFGIIFSSLIRSITTIEDAPLWLNQFESIKGENLTKTLNKVRKHYEHELYSQLYVIATSLGSVGNPVNSFTNIGAGIGDLFYEPIYAVTSGRNDSHTNMNNSGVAVGLTNYNSNACNNIPGVPNIHINNCGSNNGNKNTNVNVVKGVKKGIESFMNHSVFGTFQAISKVAGTASEIAGALTMDEKYMEERRRFVHGQQPKDLMDGITIGAQAFGKSVADGLSSLVGEFVDGATTGNPNSLALGITKGLVAAVVKPITGVLDFTQKAAQGIQKASTVDRIGTTNRTRLPRVFYSNHHILVPYSCYYSFLFGIIKNVQNNMNFIDGLGDTCDNESQANNRNNVLNGILYMSTVFGDDSRIAVVTYESFIIIKNNGDKVNPESNSCDDIIIDYYAKLKNIQYVITGTLIKTRLSSSNDNHTSMYSEICGSPRYKNITSFYCNNNSNTSGTNNGSNTHLNNKQEEKIKVCESIFDDDNNKYNTKLIKGYGYLLKVDYIYPKLCNSTDNNTFSELISNNKLMFEIIMQMQNLNGITASQSPQSMTKLSRSNKVLLSPRKNKLDKNSSHSLDSNINTKGSEIHSMIIVTHPRTPLPHYKWIECNKRCDLNKLRDILCSLI